MMNVPNDAAHQPIFPAKIGTGLQPGPQDEATPDWRAFAATILAALEAPHRPSWAFTEVVMPVPEGEVPVGTDEADAATPPVEQAVEPRIPGEAQTLDELFDGLEAEFSPDVPGQAAAPSYTIWRPKVAALLAVLRLARTFGSAEALARRLATPGGLSLLVTGAGALDALLVRLIHHLSSDEGFWPRGTPGLMASPVSAVMRSGKSEPPEVLNALTDVARATLERGTPLVIVAASAATVPTALRELRAEIISLAPLDHEMLGELLAHACPDTAPGTDLLAGLPAGAVLSRLTPDELILALRTPDAAEAVKAIAARLTPPVASGPGLAEFPLPPEARAPLDQMLSDLQAWQAGEIPWRDVSRGLLLAGPPGSGKTEIPRLIAREAGVAVLAGSLGRWEASGARASDVIREMRAFFDQAATLAPCIVFIDELDAFGDRARPHDHNSTWTGVIVGALLECLDGFAIHEGVVPMAATNHLGKVDAAIRRPGRFDRVLTLDHPTPDLMPQAIRWQLGSDLPGADLSGLAASAAGMSGAAIAAVVRGARGRARAERRPMILDDLAAEIAEREPPLPADLRWQVAVHEAGHAVAGAATGVSVPHLLVIRPDGGLTRQVLAPSGIRRGEIEAGLVVDLAGRAAERLLFGHPSGGAGGTADSDLARATIAATALEVSWGLGQSLLWLGAPEDAALRLHGDPALRTRVESHLRRAETRALAVLRANRSLLEEMAQALVEAGVLTGAPLDALVARVTKEGAAAFGPGRSAEPRPDPPQAGSAPDPEADSGPAARSRLTDLHGETDQAGEADPPAQADQAGGQEQERATVRMD